jgi:hypothetical protein
MYVPTTCSYEVYKAEHSLTPVTGKRDCDESLGRAAARFTRGSRALCKSLSLARHAGSGGKDVAIELVAN